MIIFGEGNTERLKFPFEVQLERFLTLEMKCFVSF